MGLPSIFISNIVTTSQSFFNLTTGLLVGVGVGHAVVAGTFNLLIQI